MAGRTHNKYTRVYVNGRDMSGDARTIGPLDWTYEIAKGAAMADGSQNVMLGQPTITPGTLNAFMNNGPARNYTVLSTLTSAVVTVLIGDKADPAAGDPSFSGDFSQLGFNVKEDGWVAINAPYAEQINTAANSAYEFPWGKLVHALDFRTAVNDENGFLDNSEQTTLGGYGVLHTVVSDGTCTFKIQDCATEDGVYADLVTFDTTKSSTPTPWSEIKALATTTTVDKYLRWQLEFGTATQVKFVMSFVRGRTPTVWA